MAKILTTDNLATIKTEILARASKPDTSDLVTKAELETLFSSDSTGKIKAVITAKGAKSYGGGLKYAELYVGTKRVYPLKKRTIDSKSAWVLMSENAKSVTCQSQDTTLNESYQPQTGEYLLYLSTTNSYNNAKYYFVENLFAPDDEKIDGKFYTLASSLPVLTIQFYFKPSLLILDSSFERGFSSYEITLSDESGAELSTTTGGNDIKAVKIPEKKYATFAELETAKNEFTAEIAAAKAYFRQFTKGMGEDYEAVAIPKTAVATASTAYSSYVVANILKGVNGTGGTWINSGKANDWLKIDFSQSVEFDVLSFGARGSYDEVSNQGIGHFKLYISDNDTDWKHVYTYDSTSGIANSSVELNAVVNARYIRFDFENSAKHIQMANFSIQKKKAEVIGEITRLEFNEALEKINARLVALGG